MVPEIVFFWPPLMVDNWLFWVIEFWAPPLTVEQAPPALLANPHLSLDPTAAPDTITATPPPPALADQLAIPLESETKT